MNKNFLKLAKTCLLLGGLLAMPMDVFAEGNPYGIQYSGGTALSASNMQIAPNLTKELKSLVRWNDSENKTELVHSSSNLWREGYVRTNAGQDCIPTKYIRIYESNQLKPSDNVSYSIRNNRYTTTVKINNVFLEDVDGLSEDGKGLAVLVSQVSSHINARYAVYSEPTCADESEVEDIMALSYTTGSKVYVDTTIKLYETDTGKLFTSDQLYFGITDVDACQSYKIMNPSNLLTKNNMFALSAEALQPDSEATDFKNMYVADGNYIYAEFTTERPSFDIKTNDNNIFVKTTLEAQREGLNVIFGFGNGAGSGVFYYAKQYKTTYQSDENGEITGIKSEDIVSGHTPSGSKTGPKEGYVFKHWIADKDVILTDGTTVKAGEPITIEQIKEVVVNDDIVFTAIYEIDGEAVAVPDTGIMTGETNGEIVIAGVAISVVLVMAILGNYAYQRKKHQVKF